MTAERLARAAALLQRYGLVLMLAWFGAFKFTEVEALAIEPLLRHSPLMSWMYGIFDVRNASRVIGLSELGIAALLAVPRRWILSAVGGTLAACTFLATLSFLLTTPGMWAWADGFLVPSGPGGFIVKDLFLLAAALAIAADGFHRGGRVRQNGLAAHSI